MKTGLQIISEERERQVSAEGWTPEHDTLHADGELAKAAACYAMPAGKRSIMRKYNVPWLWPFGVNWWKPTPDNRIKELAKAGALIAAEIDRLQRLANKPVSPILPAEAVTAFCAWLTTREGHVCAGANIEPSVMVEAMKEFFNLQEWQPCRAETWTNHIKPAK